MAVSRRRMGRNASVQSGKNEVRKAAASPNPNIHNKKHEVMWFKGIQGFLTAHLIERAWHGDEVTPDSILASAETRRSWQQWFDGVRISGIPDERLNEPAGKAN